MARRRDWVAAKVAYIREESAKWRALVTLLKTPYSILRALGLSPAAAIGLLTMGSTAGAAVVVNETLLSNPSFSRGDHGVYTAPSDVPVVYSDADNTLRVDLGTVPVGEIVIDSVHVGTSFDGSVLPAGETNVVVVGGVGGAATYLEIGELVIDRWRCTTFEMSDVETHTLIISGNYSDGHSLSPTPGTPRRRGIGGGNRAASMKTEGGTYDQIKIQAPTPGVNGKIDKLTLTNLFTKGGPCKISRIKAGSIEVSLMETGADNSFITKDFVITTSTVASVIIVEDNVEGLIVPP
tara:strand:+ start:10944 stop:11825 length:882 start_codon:yes stop_codon:yes gene_type:complete